MSPIIKHHSSVFILSLTVLFACAQQEVAKVGQIQLNQIGFYPTEKKIAIVTTDGFQEFSIATPDLKTTVFKGQLSGARKSAFSGKKTQIADFTEFTKEGKYVVVVPGVGVSYNFEIKPQVHANVAKGVLKAFYFQRFSTALTEEFAGKWKRPFSHADTQVLIHPSAASDNRPAGSYISSPRGWIDAGDYNKYIVNSGISTGTLLSAYEDYPQYYDSLQINIPESKNDIPDILDETLWNLRWMLTMQDPNDGGVYHKCTNASFDPMVMPHEAKTPRYVVQKSTAAALDFAAVTAQAARVFRKFEAQLPGLADSCLLASKLAWQWSQKNPDKLYDQDQMNKLFDPDVTTGGYGDKSLTDEFIWAACELNATTGDESYLRTVNLFPDDNMPIPSWGQVRLLGYYCLIKNKNTSPELAQQVEKRLIALGDQLILNVQEGNYATVMGGRKRDFEWGSNAVAGNQAIALIQVYRITNDKKYLDGAMSNLDYLLGRNATGYSFVTGFGSKTPMHIHHRPSESDNIEDPVPGLIAGGPNPGMQDKCSYPSSIPDEAYVDDVCSYASNEVAINWNAPLVYLTGAMEAIHAQR